MKQSKHLKIVIKLGTSSIVDEATHEPILSNLTLIVETAAHLKQAGHDVIIVSSGAVGVGLRQMNIKTRPKNLPRVQALAAVGQCQLMSIWDSLFAHLRQPVAQVLITRTDIVDRAQYINAQNTLGELLNLGVIPIVNENDTLAVSEIKFGDNDTLSAITAAMIQADYLFLLTDVDGLYTANPRTDHDAKVIEVVEDISSLEADVSTSGSSLGTGGMGSKITAARLATSVGITTIITRSSVPGNVQDIVDYLESHNDTPGSPDKDSLKIENGENGENVENGENGENGDGEKSDDEKSSPPLHTRFLPSLSPMQSRSFWLLHGLTSHGVLYIDTGAYDAILNKSGLLPAGVLAVDGQFGHLESVKIVVIERSPKSALNGDFPHQEPKEVGRALVNYGSQELSRIKGLRSNQIHDVLGYADSEYVALRENIAFFQTPLPSRPPSPELNGQNGNGHQHVHALSQAHHHAPAPRNNIEVN